MKHRAVVRAPIQRHSVAEQVLAHLREGIATGRWRQWLPTERGLATSLHVSRSTLRFALAELRRDGTLEAIRARGNRIVAARPGHRAAATHTVGLLTPGPLHLHAPFAHTWIDRLRAALHDQGLGVEVHENSPVYTQGRPDDTLARLVGRNPHDCWIPVLSTAALQGWFVRHRVPCVLAGSPQHGIGLPSVDVDFFAACRHAALTLLRLGHRHLVLLNEKSDARGYTFSQTGFLQGVADYGDPSVEIAVRRFRSDERITPAQLARHFRSHQPATAIVVMTAGRCLMVLGCLAQLGLRVPRDVSLICRSSGSFLDHMVPYPAHYDFQPDKYAALLARHVLAQVRHRSNQSIAHRLTPKFVRGESIAPPPIARTLIIS